MSIAEPPGQPPAGPPAETLDFGSGEPLPPGGGGPRGRRRGALTAVGTLAVLGVAGASWAAWSFFSGGPQPAQALPSTTVAYLSVDLDPSGGQKIEALRTLRKFPAFKEHIGLETEDDIREWIFEEIQGECDAGLDYATDVEPWLGDRFAIAAVEVDQDAPAPVVVLQVGDGDAADEGLSAIRAACAEKGAEEGAEEGAWVIRDGWALIAETQETVDRVAADAEKRTLDADEDYQRWTGEVGDAGIISMYAAPAVGEVLSKEMRTSSAGEVCETEEDGTTSCSALDDGASMSVEAVPVPAEAERAAEALEDFRGAAATVRFADGGLEVEFAGDDAVAGSHVTGDQAGDLVSTLPGDTVAAVGLSLGSGWAEELLKSLADVEGGSLEEMSAELGIDLPEDAETLVGDAIALALGPDFDFSAEDDAVPGIGVKVLGDAGAIEEVLGKLRESAVAVPAQLVESDASEDAVAIGPDAGYRARLLEDGRLGDSATFGRVVENADRASGIGYVDFDAVRDLVADLIDDSELIENLEPLDAFGLSTWVEGDSTHGVFKITTD